MAELQVSVGGRPYRLACRDGDEEPLRAAARLLDRHATDVIEGLGAVGEARLLLMAALQVAGAYLDQKGAAAPAAPADPVASPAAITDQDPALDALVARAEGLADALEALAGERAPPRAGLEKLHPSA